MQRVLVILAATVLVAVSLGVGALAANWPFWRRAWAWHAADGGWPQALPGPQALLRGGGGAPLQFDPAAHDLSTAASGARTDMLLRMREGSADAWLAPGFDASLRIDGRGLAVAVLPALFAQLETMHPGLMERPIGAWIDSWRQDQRGALTPGTLLALVAGGIDTPPAPVPLNPFSARAQLAAGPDFHRAALAAYGTSGAEDRRPAAAQLLASVAAAVEQRPFAAVLQQHLWSGVAAGDATLMLDRRRGEAAAHCCLEASAADWLRLGMHLSKSAGSVRVMASDGRALVVGPAGAALWVGSGAPPSGLEILLHPARME